MKSIKAICKAFGSEERTRLLMCLAKPKTVGELLELCALSQSSLSQHLKVLRDAKAVSYARTGRHIVYRADKKALLVAKSLINFHK